MNGVAALAWRNLWRRPQRTTLSLVSIAAVSALLVFMLSFQMGVYQTMTENTLRIFDGFAQIQPIGYAEDPGLERTIDSPARTAVAALDAGNGTITVASPRVNAFAILANDGRSVGAAVIGVEPASEVRVSTIPRIVRNGRYLTPGDSDSAVVGELLARNLGLSVGKRVTLLGNANDGSIAADILTVRGIYRSGMAELDRNILEMPYRRAQQTFVMGDRANTIVLSGPSLTDLDSGLPALASTLRPRHLTVLDWASLEPALQQNIALKYAMAMVFYLTLVVVVAFIILNTLLMSVLERTAEFGTLLAIGMRPSLVGRMIWIELLLLALLGAIVGISLGAGATLWFEHAGIYFRGLAKLLAQFGLPSRLYPKLGWISVSIGPAAIIVAICLGGIVPFLRVSRLTAANAMRGT